MFFVVYFMVFLSIQASVVMLIRNQKVYRHSIDMLNRVHAKAEADINKNRDWCWRYDELNSVPYFAKVLKFWKSFNSFYPKDPAREDR